MRRAHGEAATRRSATALLACAGALVLVAALASAPLDLESVSGEARYHASDQRSSWVGVAPLVVEHLVFDADALAAGALGSVELVAVVRVAELRSGNALRDLQARRSVFDADAHPEARFVLRRVEPVETAEARADPSRTLQLLGDLTLRGTTRAVVASARLVLDDATASVTATLDLSLEAFDLPAPRFLTWVVDDHVRVEVDATWPLDPGSRATTPPPAPPAPAAAATPPAGSDARR